MERPTRTLSAALVALLVATAHAGSARATNHALILTARENPFFAGEAKALASALHKRGYEAELVDTEAPGMKGVRIGAEIQAYLQGEAREVPGGVWFGSSGALVSHDRLLLAIECDGGLNPGVFQNTTARVDPHGFVVATGGQPVGFHTACGVTSSSLLTYAKLAKDRDIELVVIDSSCSGGAATFLLEPVGVCAISTTAPGSPAVSGDPPFSQFLDKAAFPFLVRFSDLAAAAGLTIFAQFPERAQQSGYYSTASGRAAPSMTLRAAVFALEQSLADWNLFSTDVYPAVFRYTAQHEPPAVQAKLALREPPPSPSSPDLPLLLQMAANFDDILKEVTASVDANWTAEDAELNAPTAAAARRAALFAGYRDGEFVTSPLVFSTAASGRGRLLSRDQQNHLPLLAAQQIPPTLQATHRAVIASIRQIQRNQVALTAALTRLETEIHARRTPAGAAAQDLALSEILKAQTSDQAIMPRLSKLLGIIEYVDRRSDASPCDIGIS